MRKWKRFEREKARETGFCDEYASVCDPIRSAETRLEQTKMFAISGGAWRIG